MAVKKRQAPAQAVTKNVGRNPVVGDLALPTGPSEPKKNLHEYTILLYGERKIGKTSLASQFENPLFFMFEPGGSSLEARQVRIPTWGHFLEYLTLLERNPGYCQTVVIDTGSVAYEKCLEYVCRRENMIHPSDEDYGKGWKLVTDEFKKAHDRIFNMGLSFIVTAHSEIKSVQRRDGTKYHKLTVDLSGSCFKYYCGTVDIIAYYQYDPDGSRVLTIRGDANVEAGVRCRNNFIYKNGTPMIDIPMGVSEEEAYDNFMKSFKNQFATGKAKAPVVKKSIPKKPITPARKRR